MLADIAEETFDADDYASTGKIRQHLAELYPSISAIPYVIAVNDEIIHGDRALEPGDSVSLLPPFSGG